MKYQKILLFTIFCILMSSLFSCKHQEDNTLQTNNSVYCHAVTLHKDLKGFSLYKNGKPFFIKGACGDQYYDKIKYMGGNSVRVWDTKNAQKTLDQAHKQGLTVMLGIFIQREKEGFDFYDPEAVNELKKNVRKDVLRYRNHPALLMWCIGNELDLGLANVKAWRVVNEIAAIIHQLDPDHPITTPISHVIPEYIRLLKNEVYNIDIISVNRYRGLFTLARDLHKAGWNGPYIVTEYGSQGYWEIPENTEWGSPIEPSSSQKAQFISSQYKAAIMNNSSNCLGSYVFIWGQKQEYTPTWFGLFTVEGEKTAAVDMMQYLWSGQWPINRAPYLVSVQLLDNNKAPCLRLYSGNTYSAQVVVQDPEKDPIRYHWEVLPDISWRKLDGSVNRESKPNAIRNVLLENNKACIRLNCPLNSGPYRLFVYAYDGEGNAATANIAFFVD